MMGIGLNNGGYTPVPTGQTLQFGNNAGANNLTVNGNLRLTPIYIPTTFRLASLGLHVTGAGDVGCVCVAAIYSSNSLGQPQNLLVASGNLAGDAVGDPSSIVNAIIPAGTIFAGAFVLNAPVTAPTLRVVNAPTVGPLGSVFNGNVPPAVGPGFVNGGFTQSGLAAIPSIFGGTGNSNVYPQLWGTT